MEIDGYIILGAIVLVVGFVLFMSVVLSDPKRKIRRNAKSIEKSFSDLKSFAEKTDNKEVKKVITALLKNKDNILKGLIDIEKNSTTIDDKKTPTKKAKVASKKSKETAVDVKKKVSLAKQVAAMFSPKTPGEKAEIGKIIKLIKGMETVAEKVEDTVEEQDAEIAEDESTETQESFDTTEYDELKREVQNELVALYQDIIELDYSQLGDSEDERLKYLKPFKKNIIKNWEIRLIALLKEGKKIKKDKDTLYALEKQGTEIKNTLNNLIYIGKVSVIDREEEWENRKGPNKYRKEEIQQFVANFLHLLEGS